MDAAWRDRGRLALLGQGISPDWPRSSRRTRSSTCLTRSTRCFNAVVAMELLAEGAWQGAGVLSAESFNPDPYLAILDRDGIHHATIELEPGRAVA